MYYRITYKHKGESKENLLYEPGDQDYCLVTAKLTLAMGKAGDLTVDIPTTNPAYDDIVCLTDEIIVYEGDDEIWRGRSTTLQTDFYRTGTLDCEGVLSYLYDTYFPPFDFSGSPKTLLQQVIDNHNACVGKDSEKYIELGDVTVEDPNDYIARSSIDYNRSLEILQDKFVNDSLGGFFRIRMDNGVKKLDYLENYAQGSVASQEIRYAENLLDIAQEVQYTDTASAILPLGAKIEDEDGMQTDEYTTIAPVNGGSIYWQDDAAVASYGWICVCVTWDDVTDPSNLLSRAKTYLAQVSNAVQYFSVNAVDLSKTTDSEEPWRIGDMIRLYSKPHNLNQYAELSEMALDLLNPDNDTYTFGSDTVSMTGSARNSARDLQTSLGELSVRMDNLSVNVINAVYGEIQHLISETITTDYIWAEVGELVTADIENLIADRATIEELEAVVAWIGRLDANYVTVDMLVAEDITAGNIASVTAQILDLLGTSITEGTVNTIILTADNAIIDLAVIAEAVAGSVVADMLYADYIDTNLIHIGSEDGTLMIDDSTILICDADGNPRIQIGLDGTGDYNLALWDADGNCMWNASGVTEYGINDGVIRNDMVADDAAIQGSKLDIASVAECLNADGSLILQASQVYIGDEGLSIVLAEMQAQIDSIDPSQWELYGIYDAVDWFCLWDSGTDAPDVPTTYDDCLDVDPDEEFSDTPLTFYLTETGRERVPGSTVTISFEYKGAGNIVVRHTLTADGSTAVQRVTADTGDDWVTFKWTFDVSTLGGDNNFVMLQTGPGTVSYRSIRLSATPVVNENLIGEVEDAGDYTYYFYLSEHGLSVVAGQTVTFSFEYRSESSFRIMGLYDLLDDSVWVSGVLEYDASDDWALVSITFTVGDTLSDDPYLQLIFRSTQPDEIRNWKLELGDHATTGAYWTTERLTAGEGEYLWTVTEYLQYSGSSIWGTPICLTDGYLRTTTTTLLQEFEVMDGHVESLIAQVTNIEGDVSGIQSDFNLFYQDYETTINTISSSVELATENASAALSQVDTLTITVEGLSNYVTESLEILVPGYEYLESSVSWLIQNTDEISQGLVYVETLIDGLESEGLLDFQAYYALSDSAEEPPGVPLYDDRAYAAIFCLGTSILGRTESTSAWTTEKLTGAEGLNLLDYYFGGDSGSIITFAIGQIGLNAYGQQFIAHHTVVLSVEYSGKGKATFTSRLDTSSVEQSLSIEMVEETDWTVTSWTFTVDDLADDPFIEIENDGLLFRNIKLELGSTATDFNTGASLKYVWMSWRKIHTDGTVTWSEPELLTDAYTNVQWSYIHETLSGITLEVGGLVEGYDDLYYSVSQIEMKVDNLKLSLTTVNGQAAIELVANGESILESDVAIAEGIQFAANNGTGIIISAGTVVMESNTLQVISDQFRLDSLGDAWFSGTLSAPKGCIGAWIIDDDAIWTAEGWVDYDFTGNLSSNLWMIRLQSPHVFSGRTDDMHVIEALQVKFEQVDTENNIISYEPYGDPTFYVTYSGFLYAMDAEIHGTVVTTDGYYSMHLTSGDLEFWVSDLRIGQFRGGGEYADTGMNGIALALENYGYPGGAGYIAFGARTTEQSVDWEYEPVYVINYGINPSDRSERHVFYDDGYFEGGLTIGNSFVVTSGHIEVLTAGIVTANGDNGGLFSFTNGSTSTDSMVHLIYANENNCTCVGNPFYATYFYSGSTFQFGNDVQFNANVTIAYSGILTLDEGRIEVKQQGIVTANGYGLYGYESGSTSTSYMVQLICADSSNRTSVGNTSYATYIWSGSTVQISNDVQINGNLLVTGGTVDASYFTGTANYAYSADYATSAGTVGKKVTFSGNTGSPVTVDFSSTAWLETTVDLSGLITVSSSTEAEYLYDGYKYVWRSSTADIVCVGVSEKTKYVNISAEEVDIGENISGATTHLYGYVVQVGYSGVTQGVGINATTTTINGAAEINGLLTVTAGSSSYSQVSIVNRVSDTVTYFSASAAWNNTQITFGIGAGGTNRGIYDNVADRWLIYADSDNRTNINGSVYLQNGRGLMVTDGDGNGQTAFCSGTTTEAGTAYGLLDITSTSGSSWGGDYFCYKHTSGSYWFGTVNNGSTTNINGATIYIGASSYVSSTVRIGLSSGNPVYVQNDLRLTGDHGMYIGGIQTLWTTSGVIGIGPSAKSNLLCLWGSDVQINGTNIVWSGTTWTDSDRSLKGDIKQLDKDEETEETLLDELDRLEPVQFTMNEETDGRIHYGYIADDVEEVMPELVYTHDDGIRALGYTQIIPLLHLKIKSLESRIAELESALPKTK